MNRAALLLAPAIVIACCSASPTAAPFDEAENLWLSRDIPKARRLYIRAAATDPDPVRRDRAAIRAAALDWHVFQDAAAARTRLASVKPESTEYAMAWLHRARLETELAHDDAAREAAQRAFAAARTSSERALALTRGAAATIQRATTARIAGRCLDDTAALTAAIVELHQAIDLGGPLLEPSRLLLDAALITRDGASALQAWRWYYADKPSGIAAVDAQLATALLAWKSRDIALALAASRLFPEADLILRDPCVKEGPAGDPVTRDLVTYAASLRRLDALASAHYRSVAAHAGDGNLKRDVLKEGEALWKALTWPGAVPPFSAEAAMKELGRRFGTIVSLGETDDIPTLLMGHTVIDETRTVEQYGHKAALRFVQLDGMISSGYAAWLTYDERGTGGWAGDDGSIYQIRPMYADGAVNRWRRNADPDARAKRERDIADETRRDADRARTRAISHLPGLEMRLQQQAVTAIRDQLAATGLSGDALRDAAIARLSRDLFNSSIWAHEGRHAIDKKDFGIRDSPELEFRAKLSEIALSGSPRFMGSVMDPIGGSSAHGRANERILTGVVAWMRAHAAEISGLDVQQPLLPQLDRLTDDQIRAAFRSLDPLVKSR
jgi:hypothetical protein